MSRRLCRGSAALRFLRFLLPCLLALVLMGFAGCRKLNDEPPVQETPPLEGSYVGVAVFDGTRQNVLLGLVGPDSSGRIEGTIHHSGGAWTLATAALDSSGDTLRFSYHPGDVAQLTDSAWALLGATGLRVHYLTPASVPAFDLNREIGGTNMTGLWSGQMYSRILGQWRNASMDISQTGDLYGGTVDVALDPNAHCVISSGVTSGGTFQLLGTARMLQVDYPVAFTGQYAGLDSLVGNWQIDIYDGSFVFHRLF